MDALKKIITEHILKIASNISIKIIIAEILTHTDLDMNEDYVHVPHLDISTIIKSGDEFDIAFRTAKKENEFGYVSDLYGFEDHEYVESEIRLDSIYFPDWPNNINHHDATVVSILKKIVKENTSLFNHIERFYFHHFEELSFIPIFEKK